MRKTTLLLVVVLAILAAALVAGWTWDEDFGVHQAGAHDGGEIHLVSGSTIIA